MDLGQPRPTTVSAAVAAAMKQPLAYPTGSEARYGFTDFTILRAVIEKVTGTELPTLLDREIAKPLGFSSTGFAMATDGDVRTGELIPKRASIYGWTGQRQRTSQFFFEQLGYGAGGLYSSARDLATLFAALDQGKVLSSQSLQAIMTPAILPNGRIPASESVGLPANTMASPSSATAADLRSPISFAFRAKGERSSFLPTSRSFTRS